MPRLPVAVLLAGALALAACGGGGDDDVSAPAGSDPLDFVAPDGRGGQVVGADFAGQDLVIWFWAPW